MQAIPITMSGIQGKSSLSEPVPSLSSYLKACKYLLERKGINDFTRIEGHLITCRPAAASAVNIATWIIPPYPRSPLTLAKFFATFKDGITTAVSRTRSKSFQKTFPPFKNVSFVISPKKTKMLNPNSTTAPVPSEPTSELAPNIMEVLQRGLKRRGRRIRP